MALNALAMLASLSMFVVTPAPAPAGDQAPAGEQTETAKKVKPKKICRTIRNTGMRTLARQCKTEAQWQAERERANGEDLGVKSDGN